MPIDRERILHLYWKVDDERLYQILQSHLQDVDDLIHFVTNKYL